MWKGNFDRFHKNAPTLEVHTKWGLQKPCNEKTNIFIPFFFSYHLLCNSIQTYPLFGVLNNNENRSLTHSHHFSVKTIKTETVPASGKYQDPWISIMLQTKYIESTEFYKFLYSIQLTMLTLEPLESNVYWGTWAHLRWGFPWIQLVQVKSPRSHMPVYTLHLGQPAAHDKQVQINFSFILSPQYGTHHNSIWTHLHSKLN